MTEAEWRCCTDPEPLLEFVADHASVRKLLLVACACLRRDAAHDGVEAVERLADEPALPAETAAARDDAYFWRSEPGDDHASRVPSLGERLANAALDRWRELTREARTEARSAARRAIAPQTTALPARQPGARFEEHVFSEASDTTEDRTRRNTGQEPLGVCRHVRSVGRVGRPPAWEPAWATAWGDVWGAARLPVGGVYEPANWPAELRAAWDRVGLTMQRTGWELGPHEPDPFGGRGEWKDFESLFTRNGVHMERAALADLVRDAFGPRPFRPVGIDPRWQTSDVLALCRGIYEDYAFDRLPILADAL